MILGRFPHLAAVAAWLICAIPSIEAARSEDFDALSEQANQNYLTREGQKYFAQFQSAIRKAFMPALGTCVSTVPETKEPAQFIFVVAANGRVKRLEYSETNPLAECIGSKLREIKTAPRPPRDSWVIAVAATNHFPGKEAKGPVDQPMRLSKNEEISAYKKAIAPYVAKARATYPGAKTRFLAGLPKGHEFLVRIQLTDPDGSGEDSFVKVEKIEGGIITGSIESKLDLVKHYKTGQRMSFPESRIDNWMISNPDGPEEGNYVGKFLDHYKRK
jgi:hypothetical protein